jgi:hypothetical protein
MKKLRLLIWVGLFLVVGLVINSGAFWSLASLFFIPKHYTVPIVSAAFEADSHEVQLDLSNNFLIGDYSLVLKTNLLESDQEVVVLNGKIRLNNQEMDISSKGLVRDGELQVELKNLRFNATDNLILDKEIYLELSNSFPESFVIEVYRSY